MDEYLVAQFNRAVSNLNDLLSYGTLNSLNGFNDLVNQGYINLLKSACDTLRDAQQSGVIDELKQFNETGSELNRTIKGYEANRLCDALDTIKKLLGDENKVVLERLSTMFDADTFKAIKEFSDAVTMLNNATRELTTLKNTAATISHDVKSLSEIVASLGREIYDLQQTQKANERNNINLEIRNYLDLLKDPELMKKLGITREIIAAKLAELLNKNGLDTNYLLSVANSEPVIGDAKIDGASLK